MKLNDVITEAANPAQQAAIAIAKKKKQGVAEVGPVTIGSKLPKSDTATFGIEPGRGYKVNDPKDWKKGDRPRAIQQLIPTQDKKDHIRSRLGKHAAPVLPEQGMAEDQMDEGWKDKLAAAGLAGAMALGASGANARVSYDADGNKVGGFKPVATQQAGGSGQESNTVDSVSRDSDGSYTITHNNKEYQVKIVPKNMDLVPRGATKVSVTQAQMGIRGIGTYVAYLLPNGTAFLLSGQPTNEQAVAEDREEYRDEAGMARTNLITIARAAQGLLDTVDQYEDLPEWVQEKIAKVEQMLVVAWDYLKSQEAQGIDPRITEGICTEQEAHAIFDDFEQVVAARGLTEDIYDTVTDEDIIRETAAWRRKEGKSKKGGLNAKGVASYRRENPGSKLQMAVTTKPSKLKPGSKAAKRRKSFCARMSGVKGPMKKPNGKPTRKALALRKWNC